MVQYTSNIQASINYAEMYIYSNAVETAINVGEQYHYVQGLFAEDHINDWTFAAGSEGTGNITTAAAGAAINIADGIAHNLVSGDIINVQSANHTGTAVVTYIDANNFTVPIAYVGDEACFWQQGDRLIAGDSAAGTYAFGFSTSLIADGNAKTYKFELTINTTHIDESACQRKIGTGADVGSMGCTGLIDIAAGDIVALQVKNVDADTTNLTLIHANVNIHKL